MSQDGLSRQEDFYRQKMEDNMNANLPTGKAPVTLTMEELKVLKECRTQSLAYRGIPAGVFGVLSVRAAIMSGKFPRVAAWSGAFYAGTFGLGVLLGVGSYRRQCLEKILALENSSLGDQLREFQRQAGIPVTPKPSSQSSEFDTVMYPQSIDSLARSARNNEEQEVVESPAQLSDSGNKWDEIRSQTRRSKMYGLQGNHEPGQGISFEELRQQHRNSQLQRQNEANSQQQRDQQHQEETSSGRSNIDLYTPNTYLDDRESRAFTSVLDKEPVGTLFSSDEDIQVPSTARGGRSDMVRKKTFAEATGRKNQYGDEME